jgi:hypothetical protein
MRSARFGFRETPQEEKPAAEHRGSRMHMDEDPVREAPREPIDRMFREAADSGFEPLTKEQAEDFREKLRGASAAIHGGRR